MLNVCLSFQLQKNVCRRKDTFYGGGYPAISTCSYTSVTSVTIFNILAALAVLSCKRTCWCWRWGYLTMVIFCINFAWHKKKSQLPRHLLGVIIPHHHPAPWLLRSHQAHTLLHRLLRQVGVLLLVLECLFLRSLIRHRPQEMQRRNIRWWEIFLPMTYFKAFVETCYRNFGDIFFLTSCNPQIRLYLIPLVSKYPSIWKNKSEFHKLTNVRENDWEEILSALKDKFGRACLSIHSMATVKGLKSVWASLRGYYMGLERKRKGSSGASAAGNFYLSMFQFCFKFYHDQKKPITDVWIPPWPYYASMHFLRESLTCLPTKSSLGEGADNTLEDNTSTSGRIAKWQPKDAAKKKKMINERFILAMENIGGKISETSGGPKQEDCSKVDPFFMWLDAEYKKLEPEKQKAFKRDVTMTVTNYMWVPCHPRGANYCQMN